MNRVVMALAMLVMAWGDSVYQSSIFTYPDLASATAGASQLSSGSVVQVANGGLYHVANGVLVATASGEATEGYDDTAITDRVEVLENTPDADTIYDDTALAGRVEVLENTPDADTVYDDTAVIGRLDVIEATPDADTIYDDTAVIGRLDTVEELLLDNDIDLPGLISSLTPLELVKINSLLGQEVDIASLPGVFAYWDSSQIDNIRGFRLDSPSSEIALVEVNSLRIGGVNGDLSTSAALRIDPDFVTSGAVTEWEVDLDMRYDPANTSLIRMDIIRSSEFDEWRLRMDDDRFLLQYVDGAGNVQARNNINFPQALDTSGSTSYNILLRGSSTHLEVLLDGVVMESVVDPEGFSLPDWEELGRHNTFENSYFLERLELRLDGAVVDTWSDNSFSVNESMQSETNNSTLRVIANGGFDPYIDQSSSTVNSTIFNLAQVIGEVNNSEWVAVDTDIFFSGGSANTLDLSSTQVIGNQVIVNYTSSSNYQIAILNVANSENAGILSEILTVQDLSTSSIFIDLILHGGQSNGVGEGDARTSPELLNSQVRVAYNFNDFYEFGTQSSFLSANRRFERGAEKFYGEALARHSENTPAIFKYAVGGQLTTAFSFPNNSGSFGEYISSGLPKVIESLESEFPNKTVRFKAVYWDQVERDGGNGSRQDLTLAEFQSQVEGRANTIAGFYDRLTGNGGVNDFSVTNPDLIMFLRDISDGQWEIGGGGVALSADTSHPDYIIKANPSEGFNVQEVNGERVPYTSSVTSNDPHHFPDAEWNGWMVIRTAHQLLTDPSHGSEHYREGIRLVNADGIGTRGEDAISGDGTHFGGDSMKIVAERFLEVYNDEFGENIVIDF